MRNNGQGCHVAPTYTRKTLTVAAWTRVCSNKSACRRQSLQSTEAPVMNVVPFARGQPASDYSECGGKTQVLRQRSSLKFSRALSELSAEIVDLIERLIELIPWPARRRAMGDITVALLDGKQRVAEDVFGWNRRRAMGFSGMSVLVQDVLKARTCQRFPACIEKQFRNRRSPTYCKRVFLRTRQTGLQRACNWLVRRHDETYRSPRRNDRGGPVREPAPAQ